MKTIILIINFAALTISSLSQHPFEGIWEGKIKAGTELRVIFTLSQKENKNLIATMDLPDNGIKGIVSSDVLINQDSLTINVKEFQGSFSGKLVNPTTITGSWKQGISTALQLSKVEKVEVIKKPQTPVPPFSYKSEDVIYTSSSGTIQYGATITLPFGEGPFPGIVLITGSGQQNRDEELSGHKPFAVIADYLTKNGFAVLRVDDRGVGQTTGNVTESTTLDFADDINTALDFLTSKKEIDKKRLCLIGHSEGGMIASILGAKRKDISAIVLLAAPGESGSEILIQQNRASLLAVGLPEESVNSYIDLYSSILDDTEIFDDKDAVREKIAQQVDKWLKKTPAKIIAATTGIINDEKKEEYIDAMARALNTLWLRYFIKFQPAEFLQQLSCNVFALNGSKDVQILSHTNLNAIEIALKKSKSKMYKIQEYEGLNHQFQQCNSCSVQEYGALQETISIDVLKDIVIWLKTAM